MDPIYNEPIAAVIVGMLLSVAAGFRIMLPLLAVNLMAVYKVIVLPDNLAWLGSEPTTIVLAVAFCFETLVHFIPAAGTGLKAVSTPLAFVAGTLLMAVPLSGHNPLYQWTLAATLGGGLAALVHLGVTGTRTIGEPANIASLGTIGLFWNLGELFVSGFFAGLGTLAVFAGWAVGGIALFAFLIFAIIVGVKMVSGLTRSRGRQVNLNA